MDDGVGVGPDHRVAEGVGVVDVADCRFSANRAQSIGLPFRSRHARDLVTVGDQDWHQPDTDDPGRPRDEDPHRA